MFEGIYLPFQRMGSGVCCVCVCGGGGGGLRGVGMHAGRKTFLFMDASDPFLFLFYSILSHNLRRSSGHHR